MNTSKRAKSKPASGRRATANDWTELARRWQDSRRAMDAAVGRCRARGLSAAAATGAASGADVAPPAAAVSIDPAAAAHLTERYAARFEALWARAAAKADSASAGAGPRRPAILGQGLARASVLRVAARRLSALRRVRARIRRAGRSRRCHQAATGLYRPAICGCDLAVEFPRHEPRGAATRARDRRDVDRARLVEPGRRTRSAAASR